MNMRRKFIMSMIAAAFVMTTAVGNAAAITNSDVSTTILDPEANEEVSVGGFFNGGLSYEVELENTHSSNDTTADTYVKVTDNSGHSVSEWVNGTSVTAGSTVTVTDEIDVSDLNYESATITADTTYTDDGDGSTATASDSVDFQLVEGFTMAQLMKLIEVLILLSIIGMITSKLT